MLVVVTFKKIKNTVEAIQEAYYEQSLRLFYFSLAPDGPSRNFTAVANSSTTVYLTWMPPLESLQNGVITEYRIKCLGKSDSGSELRANQTYYLLTGLQKFTRYNISVKAGNEVGFGPSEYIIVTTLADGMKQKNCFIRLWVISSI